MQGLRGVLVLAMAWGVGVAGGRSQAPAGAAQAGASPAGAAPAGATARCNDGSYSTAKQKWQACGGHKGVQAWFADGGSGGGATAKAPAGAAAKAPAGATAKAPGGAAASPGVAPKTSAASGPAAPGGGPGMVWVNLDTKVYHCPGGRLYGKTKNGKYMAEADAVKAGDRPDRGKACGR